MFRQGAIAPSSPPLAPPLYCVYAEGELLLSMMTEFFKLRARLHYAVFIRRRYRNVLFWPTIYTAPFSYPASNEDCCIRKYLNVYTMPFSYDNISIPFSYENGIV